MPLTVKNVAIGSVSPHPKNVRQGDVGAIVESLRAHGQYRPIVVQKNTGHILAGNHTWRAACALQWPEISVTEVDVDDEQALRILLVDNRTNDLATYDENALAEMLKELVETETGLDGTGFDNDALDDLLLGLDPDNPLRLKEDVTNPYSKKVLAPQYEIVGEEPAIEELYDLTRTNALIAAIDESSASEEIKAFLRLAAHRHTVFNYRSIAEFFPHQNAEVQALMRESVLVIIDFDDAMRLGFVRLDNRLTSLLDEAVNGEE